MDFDVKEREIVIDTSSKNKEKGKQWVQAKCNGIMINQQSRLIVECECEIGYNKDKIDNRTR